MNIQSKTILIAEDNEDLRGMLRQFLESHGYAVLEASDGQGAAETAIRERPDLVLMDLGLPGMDGLSAAAEIRKHAPLIEMPILMVSAYDRLEYRTEAVSAGCSGYITKPLDYVALLKTINLLLDNEGVTSVE